MDSKCLLCAAATISILAGCGGSSSETLESAIAFARLDLTAPEEDVNADIFVMNADGTHQTKLTKDVLAFDPAWSPDGERIAFVREFAGENDEIFVMNADGSAQKRLTNEPETDQSPSWSPDGRRIAWTCEDVLMVMNADGTHQSRMFEHLVAPGAIVAPHAVEDPSWSPDGTKIAFGGNETSSSTPTAPIRETSRTRMSTPETRTSLPGRPTASGLPT